MKICFKCNQLGNDDELNCRFCSSELQEISDSDELPDIDDIIKSETVIENDTNNEDTNEISFDEIYSGLKKEIRLLKVVILFFVVIVVQLLIIISLL